MAEMGELVDDHRAAIAAGLLIRPEHEVVDEQLPPALEQVEEGRDAVRSLEFVLLLDPHDRLATALGGEGVALPRHRLLLGQYALVRGVPFILRHDVREIHPSLLLLVTGSSSYTSAAPYQKVLKDN